MTFPKSFLITVVLVATAFSGCKDKATTADTDTDFVELTGDLTTRTLRATETYLIKGQVFVRSGQVLTIEPGTVILGDKRTRGTLVVDVGGQIIANGTVDRPIVMTSNQEAGIRDRGDWGGLVILGRANVNQPEPAIEGITPVIRFGTQNSTAFDNESSGSYKYLRVEFAGIELSPNNETNSITMGGVGRGTVMENVMVSFGGDDGFEWFGGTVNGKNLISFAIWDDDFDCDFGWSGNVQFGLVVRYPGFADQSQSNGIECDNGINDNDVQPLTTATFSNLTILGPIKTGSTVSNGNFGHSFDLRRRVSASIFNSVTSGFPLGVRFNQPSVLGNYQAGTGVLANNVLFATSEANAYRNGTGVAAADVKAVWDATNQVVIGAYTDAAHTAAGINPDWFFGSRLADAYPSAPNFTVTSGTILTGASFTNAKFNETNRTNFFNKTVTYRGAFGATNWTAGWAEFNPVNAEY
jgi:hypothetical protein